MTIKQGFFVMKEPNFFAYIFHSYCNTFFHQSVRNRVLRLIWKSTARFPTNKKSQNVLTF